MSNPTCHNDNVPSGSVLAPKTAVFDIPANHLQFWLFKTPFKTQPVVESFGRPVTAAIRSQRIIGKYGLKADIHQKQNAT
jgi:hypothetical protein